MSGSISGHKVSSAEAYEIVKLVKNWLDCSVHLVGSTSYMPEDYLAGDVDLVVTPNSIAGYESMEIGRISLQIGTLFGFNSTGTHRQSGIIGRAQVDIFLCENKNLGATLAFYKNPFQLQQTLRIIAHCKGLKFGPKGMRRIASEGVDEEHIPCYTENQVYDFLGFTPTDEYRRRAREYEMER